MDSYALLIHMIIITTLHARVEHAIYSYKLQQERIRTRASSYALLTAVLVYCHS